jgi:predicted ATPase
MTLAAALYQYRREIQKTHEQAEALLTLAREQGFALWSAFGLCFQGWVVAAQGQTEEGITQLRQGLAAARATGAELNRSRFLGLLAEVCRQAGRATEGLVVLDEALTVVNHTGERYYEAELYRLKGELLLQQADEVGGSPLGTEAAACFQHALVIARTQQAKSLELRAAMSLARFWQRQGKGTAAYDLLAPVYNWFTEGFDTADLQEAKALLEALG